MARMVGEYRIDASGQVTRERDGRAQPFTIPDDLVPARLRQGAALGLLLFMVRTGASRPGVKRQVRVEESGADVVVRVED